MTALQPHAVGVPLPTPAPFTRAYWEGCAVGELRYQQCNACGNPQFDPSPLCRTCGKRELAWAISTGTGEIYSWSVVWRPASPEFASPYAVAIVDVDEGFQIIANVIGCEPDGIHVGMRVAVEFHPIGGEYVLPYFRPMS